MQYPTLIFNFLHFLLPLLQLRCAAARAARAQATQQTVPSAPEKYMVPDTDAVVAMTKEQEANLPPESRMVWTVSIKVIDEDCLM